MLHYCSYILEALFRYVDTIRNRIAYSVSMLHGGFIYLFVRDAN